MAGEIFYWVLNVSILGAAAGIIVLLLRRIRALPRFGVYMLWALPLIRLWMPVGLANKYSLLNFISQYGTRTVVVWEPRPGLPEFTMTNSLQAATQYFPIEYKTDLLKDIFNVAGMAWVIIAAAAILCSILLYILTKSVLKGAEHIKENIYRSDKVLSPAVYGIIKAKIILPADIADTDIEYVLAHERTHIRRFDNLWRVVAVLTACIHWFNPLAWAFLKCFLTDMELACDAGVLKRLSGDARKEYSLALLSCSSGKTYYASAFGGSKTRLRIENILSYKRLTLLSGMCFAALFIIIAVTLITNAAGG